MACLASSASPSCCSQAGLRIIYGDPLALAWDRWLCCHSWTAPCGKGLSDLKELRWIQLTTPVPQDGGQGCIASLPPPRLQLLGKERSSSISQRLGVTRPASLDECCFLHQASVKTPGAACFRKGAAAVTVTVFAVHVRSPAAASGTSTAGREVSWSQRNHLWLCSLTSALPASTAGTADECQSSQGFVDHGRS